MKTFLTSLVILGSLAGGWAATTTINSANKYSYGANIGWMDWRGDTANGAVIGDYVCSGYIYAANVGWINLGGGSPTNGIRYLNLAAGDFGVNHDGLGNLRGYAYGANIGWINFENTGAPTVNLLTGKMSGYAYSANCGWISLSNAIAYVQTDTFFAGADTDGDGLPDAWEMSNFGNLAQTANGNFDGDPANNLQEYLAGTSPTNATSYLRITAKSFAAGGTTANLTWTSELTRFYFLEKTLDLGGVPVWVDSSLGKITPDGASTARGFADTNAPARFYRVRVVRPLAP